jgi:CheY-like chemotaxis protein
MSETSRRLKILLVEDHQDTAHALANLLAREAHRVRRVHTGGDALRAAAEQSFDLLISDLRLPDISGYEVMAQLKRKYNLMGIAVSGMSAPADIERALAAGFSQYLVKPVKLEKLREVVEAIAGGGFASPPSSPSTPPSSQ